MSQGITYTRLRDAVTSAGHAFFDRGDYNLNLVGLRTDDRRSELFNDWLCVAFRQADHPQLWLFAMTTDPGVYWRQHPLHVDGTAILMPGQYRGAWRLGLHKGQYPALVQARPMTVARDNNRDAHLDLDGDQQTGMFGINLHRAGRREDAESKVGRWSAGCQVMPDSHDHTLLIALCERAARQWGNAFTYTLLDEHAIWAPQ